MNDLFGLQHTDRETACEIENVSVEFESERVLHDITLRFPSGECSVIMGGTGSGKSTLLKCVAGLVVPSRGSVRILGLDITRATDREIEQMRSRNGFVFQDGALWQNMSLQQNLEFPVRFHQPDRSTDDIRGRIDRLVGELQATRRLNLRPAQVSGGERKIISFIRAIITEPALLFLDEPTASLDTERVDLMIRTLKRLKESGTTIIAVTHNPKLVSQLADTIVIQKQGALVAADSLERISRSNNPEIERVLTDVLSESATYDGDILELLDPDTNPFLT